MYMLLILLYNLNSHEEEKRRVTSIEMLILYGSRINGEPVILLKVIFKKWIPLKHGMERFRLHKAGLTGIPAEERTAQLAHWRPALSPLCWGGHTHLGKPFGFKLAQLKPHVGWFFPRQPKELSRNYRVFTSIPKTKINQGSVVLPIWESRVLWG